MLRVFGAFWAAVFGGLAWVGYALGVSGVRHIGPEVADSRLVVLLKDHLELGYGDHRIHLVLATVFLLAAILPKSWDESSGQHDEI